ncbi:uncharacterized protein LOC117713122 isoform X2 [Arvicanthis niloticus]|uniref:uncharacterized protein LOC117713122 isoform X2 n=1 Tax=Arvicanthis niloticus TaxID=61156 RepID=UPI00402BBCFE
MKILILTVTTLNFVIFFPYNESQEIHSQTSQRFSANPPLCKQTASNPSSTPKTEENSPREDSNSYPALLDGIAKITGSPSERSHLEMLQADLRNSDFPPSDNDQNSIGFAYAKRTVDNPKRDTSPSSDIIQDMPALSSFAPKSQIRKKRIRMPLSSENGISSPVSVTYYQYEFDLSDTPHSDRDSEITQSIGHFSPSGRTKASFASNPVPYSQNSLEKLTALADENAFVTSVEQSFLGTGTTPNEEAEQEDIFFTGSTVPIEEGIHIPRKHFTSLIDLPSKEKSAFYTEVESEAEEDAVFQKTEDIPSSHNLHLFELQHSNLENDGFPGSDTTNFHSQFTAVPSPKITINEEEDSVFQETEDIPSSHNLEHFEVQYSNLENNGFPYSDTVNSHSQFSVVPSTKITINDRDLIIPEEEHVDALYVTNPTNRKIYFKPMATRTKINSADEGKGTKHKVETEGSAAVPTASDSMLQIERTSYSRPLTIYYDVISKPIPGAKQDPYAAWNTNKNKQLSSTMYSGNIIDLVDGYQIPTEITAIKNDRLVNKRKTESNEGRNNMYVITDVVNDNFYEDKDNIKIDLTSIIGARPIRKYIIKSNDIKTLKEKPYDLGRASSDHPKVFRDEETVLIDDSITPFNPSQSKNAVKEIWTTILAPKTYLPKKTTKTAAKVGMTIASHEAENILSSPQHESEVSFEEDAPLKYEADLQRMEIIKSEEKDTFEDEIIRDYIENSLAGTQYSTNPNAYKTITFRRITKPRAGQPGFEVLKTVVSKPLLRNFNSEVHKKMTAENSNHDSNSDDHFNDNTYTVVEENGPNIYIFTPETMPSFIRRGSSIPMKDINSSKATNSISKTNLMAILNRFNVTKMPPNSNIFFSDISALESQEDNDNNNNSAPSVEEIRSMGLRSLLIPNQRVSRPSVSLGDSDMSTDTLVMSEVSEPTKEHLTFIEHNWAVIDEASAVKPFPQVSPVPLEDPMILQEKGTRVTNILAGENGDISDKTDSMSLSANRALQTANYDKRGINRATELVNHYVKQSAISPSAKKRDTPGAKVSTSFHNDNAVEEEKFYLSGNSTPVDLEGLDIMTVTPFIRKPLVASAQQRELGSSKNTFYPSSTISTTKLTKVQARDPLLDNLEGPTTNSYTKIYQLPMKITFSPTDFTENSNPKQLTTTDIILIPENIIKDFDLNRFLTDYSEIEPKAWDITEFFDLMNETGDQENQANKLQRDFHPLTLNSIVPSKTSTNIIRNYINNDRGSSSAMERKNIIAEMPHSQNSNIPLAEFGFISNDEFPLVYDTEDLRNMASLHFLPVNTMYTGEDAIIFENDGNSEGESVLIDEGNV